MSPGEGSDLSARERASPSGSAGVYVHLPFCVVRCTYCDFYSIVGQDDLAASYVDALVRDVETFAEVTGCRPPVATVFVGGGTPSHLPAGSVSRVLEALAGAFDLAGDVEITIEANPESATDEKLREFRAAGADRLSLGVQSFEGDFLRMMGRPHGPEAPARTVEAARTAGFENVSLDLIYGLPGQGAALWERDLERALGLGAAHLSAYLLETDKDTPLARLISEGRIEEPDAATISTLYRTTEELVSAAGLRRYEVSNWARLGYECRHNLGYWLDRPYLGFGASAHSYYLGARRACRLTAAAYVAAVARGEETRVPLDDGSRETRLAEALVTAMRLAEGADLDAIGARYGCDLWSRYAQEMRDLVARGWAEIEPPRVRLTTDGILWSLEALTPFVA